MLCNGDAVGGTVSNLLEKSVTKMYGSTLLALRGGGLVSKIQKKRYVTRMVPYVMQMGVGGSKFLGKSITKV